MSCSLFTRPRGTLPVGITRLGVRRRKGRRPCFRRIGDATIRFKHRHVVEMLYRRALPEVGHGLLLISTSGARSDLARAPLRTVQRQYHTMLYRDFHHEPPFALRCGADLMEACHNHNPVDSCAARIKWRLFVQNGGLKAS